MEKTLIIDKLGEYLSWIYKKIIIQQRSALNQIKEGEIYWCSLGENVGDEENGKGSDFRRPVLVVRKFNNKICWAVPLSTKVKENKFYYKIFLENIERSAMLSQMRILDSKRFDTRLGIISDTEIKKIKVAITDILNR